MTRRPFCTCIDCRRSRLFACPAARFIARSQLQNDLRAVADGTALNPEAVLLATAAWGLRGEA